MGTRNYHSVDSRKAGKAASSADSQSKSSRNSKRFRFTWVQEPAGGLKREGPADDKQYSAAIDAKQNGKRVPLRRHAVAQPDHQPSGLLPSFYKRRKMET